MQSRSTLSDLARDSSTTPTCIFLFSCGRRVHPTISASTVIARFPGNSHSPYLRQPRHFRWTGCQSTPVDIMGNYCHVYLTTLHEFGEKITDIPKSKNLPVKRLSCLAITLAQGGSFRRIDKADEAETYLLVLGTK